MTEIVYSESVYSVVTQQPMVKLTFKRESVTMPASDARQLGKDIILTAMAADADAFLVEFVNEELGVDLRNAVRILGEFREWREKRGPIE